MLELRYNGCPYCLSSVQSVLMRVGYTAPQNYKVEFHGDHRSDKIYVKRTDYLSEFTGAIMYNPDTQHWIDFYDKDHTNIVLTSRTKEEKDKLKSLLRALEQGA